MIKNHSRKIAIHQPNYLPWLGYFYKIYQSDVFVFLDDAQFSNKGMHNYTYIKTNNGSCRLKFPVQQRFGDKINEVRPKDELGWKDKHMAILKSNYSKAKYFTEVFNDYRQLISQDFNSISELNGSSIKFYAKKLGIKTKFINSSELNINLSKEEKIIAICNVLGASVYYSGKGAEAYQNEGNFCSNGIELIYSVFKPFNYQQLWGEFQANVSALDFFMNCGYNWDQVLNSQKKHFV